MLEELNRIIDDINKSNWNLNTKIRYAYLELGKLVHKDAFFFYTIQNNLLTQEKDKLQYSVDEIDRIMNTDNLFDYKVICRTSAEMLGYIFRNCGIEYEIRKTIEKDVYSKDDKDVEIQHYFIAVKGNEGNIYALTLNPDLPNIQVGKKTSHFGNNIPYLVEKERTDEEGNVIIDMVQNYEGSELHFSLMSDEELQQMDIELGYLSEILVDGKSRERFGYSDMYFSLIKKAYKSDGLYKIDEEYKSEMIYKTSFYSDLCILCNEKTNLEKIFPKNLFNSDNNDGKLYLDFNPLFKSEEEWNEIKRFIFYSVVLNFSSIYHMVDIDDKLKNYYELFEEQEYDKVFNLFAKDFLSGLTNEEKANIQKMGPLNPLAVMRKMKYLFKEIDKFAKNDNKTDECLLKFKTDFMEIIRIISGSFVDKKLLFNGSESSNEYITSKIITSFTKIFDIGYRTPFNDLYFGEQVVIIKEILNIIFCDLTIDKNIPDYDENKTAIMNRTLTTVIFDKETLQSYYLMCTRNVSPDSNGSTIYMPIIFDLKNNQLITNFSIIDIWNNFYIIKDSYVKLMLEDIEEKVDKKHSRL